MSLSIRTNVASLNAQRNLNATQNTLDSSLSRLSSGFRITRAGDDAAGLGISTKLESQIRSYNQATRNANDGLSVIQATESALNEQASILTRLRELAMQSSSDGIGNTERGYVDKEAQALVSELERIAQVTEYNGTKLLDGTNASGLDFQVGIASSANDVISLQAVNATTAAAGGASAPVVTAGVSAASAAAALAFNADPSSSLSAALDTGYDAATAATIAARTLPNNAGDYAADRAWDAWLVVGGGSAGQAMVTATANGSTGGNAALDAAISVFRTAILATHDAAAAQSIATTSPAGMFAFDTFMASYMQFGGTGFGTLAVDAAFNAGLAALGGGSAPATGGLGVAGLSLATKSSALTALSTIDAALATISSNRATLGATGNRLQSAINNIQSFSESLSAANSRIKDVDVAEETSRMSRSQILSQAGVSVLAQANQMPQLALKLLG